MTRGVKKLRTQQSPGSLWKRFFAFFIDIFVLDLVVASSFSELLTSFASKGFFSAIPAQIIYAVLIIAALYVTYFTVMQMMWGQTVGMMLFGLFAASVDSRPLTWWKVLITHVWIFPVFPLVLLWIIDPLVLLFSANRQRLSQRWAGVIVVEERYVL